MDHYFTDNRHLENNRKEISFRFWCFNLRFITNTGVFSKNEVDYGTRVLLDTIAERKELGDTALDLGCGYGPVGITLKSCFPDTEFTMVDVNPRAVELAKENAARNHAAAEILVSDVYQAISGNTFTDIITNPPIRAGKAVIYKMFDEAFDHLREKGVLWVVIRKQQGAESACAHIASVFGNCEVINKQKGYFILKAIKTLTS